MAAVIRRPRSADQAYQSAKGNPDIGLAGQNFPDQASLQAAQQRYDSARAALDGAGNKAEAAQDALDDLISQAKALQDRHEQEAERIAACSSSAGTPLIDRDI